MAICQKRNDNLSQSLEFIIKAVELSPDWINLSSYCNILRLNGKLEESIAAGEKAYLICQEASVCANLSLAYRAKGYYSKQLEVTQVGYRHKRTDANILMLLYHEYFRRGELSLAKEYILKAYEYHPNNQEVVNVYASYLNTLGKTDEAITVVKYGEGSTRATRDLYANLLCSKGRTKEASQILMRSVKANEHAASTHKLLQGLVDYNDPQYSWLAEDLLSNSFEVEAESLSHQLSLASARFSYYHKKKDFLNASRELFQKLDIQNTLTNPEESFELLSRKAIEERNAFLSYESLGGDIRNLCCPTNNDDFIPIFIVGLPRCGSTLIETIFSLNPDCLDLGETAMYRKAKEFAESKKAITLDEVRRISEQYRNSVTEEAKYSSSSKIRFTTDKMLYNFMYTGAIQFFMPGAKVIACRRNPMDHVLSIAREEFASGNEWSGSIATIAKSLVLYYETIDFYRSRQFGNEIIDYNYDALVKDPSREIRRIVEAIGFDWSDDYLYPEHSTRAIVTASVNQARKPISKSSLGSWKHYKEFLNPAIQIFDDAGIKY